MKKSIGEMIKAVRKMYNLTQKDLAKEFFVTEKTISNYETGLRMPDFNFISKMCEKYNLSYDYFFCPQATCSESEDLIILKKNGKCAIYDNKKGVYLTQYIYDSILLSNSGYHIVINRKKDKEGNFMDGGIIEYSAVVDNRGMVYENKGLVFGNNGSFDCDGVCPALCVSEEYQNLKNKVVLARANGEIITKKGYDRILKTDSNYRNNIYFGVNFNKTNKTIEKDVIAIANTGKEINMTVMDFDMYGEQRFKELNNIEILKKSILEYGVSIISMAQDDIFDNNSNYHQIILTVLEYLKNNEADENTKRSDMIYAITILDQKRKAHEFEYTNCLQDTELDLSIFGSSFGFEYIRGIIDKLYLNIYLRKM